MPPLEVHSKQLFPCHKAGRLTYCLEQQSEEVVVCVGVQAQLPRGHLSVAHVRVVHPITGCQRVLLIRVHGLQARSDA